MNIRDIKQNQITPTSTVFILATDSRSTSQKISRILWNPKVCYPWLIGGSSPGKACEFFSSPFVGDKAAWA
jgi:hypothetical protein